MRLCILLGTLGSGGAERTSIYLAQYGIKNGWQVDIVTLNNVKFYDVPDGCNHIILSKKSENQNLLIRIKYMIEKKIKFNRYVKENKPDVIFPILSYGIFYTYGLNKNIPIIGSERSNPAFLEGKWNIFLRNRLFRHCDGLIFQTQAARSFYEDSCGLSGIVIPNAIGNPIAFEYEKPCEKREKKIVAMGRLVAEKNYETLLEAFDIVYLKHQDYRLEIYGAGPQMDKLVKYSKKLNSFVAIKFMGANPDALRAIYNAKCYVLSSISEGMPNALMEAMAIGVPVVSTDCPNGPRDLIVNGTNGLLIEMENPQQLANAIIQYIENKNFAEEIARNGMKIKETNSIEVICKKYFDFFVSFIK